MNEPTREELVEMILSLRKAVRQWRIANAADTGDARINYRMKLDHAFLLSRSALSQSDDVAREREQYDADEERHRTYSQQKGDVET